MFSSERRTRVLLGTLIAMVAITALATGPAIAKDPKPLPRDDNNTYMEFENGLRYIFRNHSNPPDRVAFFLHVKSGALNETDTQNGLAHFLEHMAFNGSTHYAPGELIPAMSKLGMQFGAHSNAHTTHHETVYKLFMPDNTDDTVDRALTIMSDWAYGLLLKMEEIDQERGVILEEARTRKGVGQRLRDQLIPMLYPGTQYARHTVIGLDEQIQTFPRSEFLDYYNTWYRPDLMTLIVVGDVDEKKMLEKIKPLFANFKARAEAREHTSTGLSPIDHPRAIILTDEELTSGAISFQSIQKGRPPYKTSADFHFNEVENMGTWILSRRLGDLTRAGKNEFLWAMGGVQGMYDDAIIPVVRGGTEKEKWKAALAQMIYETKRAIDHGFTEQELELAKADLLSNAERMVETERTWDARGIINRISGSIGTDSPLLSAAQNLDLIRSVCATATLEEVNQVFRRNFDTRNYTYVLQLPPGDLPSRDDVLAAATEYWGAETKAPEEKSGAKPILAKMPKPGEIKSQKTDTDLGITTVTLTNGVLMHHRYMDYKENQVSIQITLPGGVMQETAGMKGVSQVANLANATSRLSSTDVINILTGKNVFVGGGMGADAAMFSISGSPKDLETGMQLAYAFLTDSKIEQSAFDNWKTQMLQMIEMEKSNAIAQFRKAMNESFFGGDHRFASLEASHLEKLTAKQGEEWLKKVLTKAPVEVAIVGDISLEDAINYTKKYLGSLPPADQERFKQMDGLRKVDRGEGPFIKKAEFETITPMAVVAAGFVGVDEREIVDRRVMHFVRQILQERMTKIIREEKQLVYGIQCQNQPGQLFKGSGMFFAASQTKPENADALADSIIEIMKEFAENGPTSDEVDVARKQILKSLETSMQEPRFWLSLMSDLSYRGRTLEEIKELPEIYKTFTADQLKDTAKKYFTDERLIRIMAVPKPDKPTS